MRKVVKNISLLFLLLVVVIVPFLISNNKIETINSNSTTVSGYWTDVYKDDNGDWLEEVNYPGEGSGEEDDPYIVSTAEELAWFAWYISTLESSSSSYPFVPEIIGGGGVVPEISEGSGTASVVSYFIKLSNDIDLSGKYWTPIGNSEHTFGGHGGFNGCGYSIIGLTLDDTILDDTYDYQGLFGRANFSSGIYNLKIENANITSSGNYTGFICGYYSYGSLSDIEVINSTLISSGEEYIGGLVGYVSSKATLTSCKFNGKLTTSGSYCGGIVGYFNNGVLSSCTFQGSLTGGNYCGGIVGCVASLVEISDCIVIGDIIGEEYIGGLIGYFNYGTIKNCTIQCNVSSTSNYCGCVCGYFSYGEVLNVRTSGSVSGISYIGGLFGSVSSDASNSSATVIANCIFSGDVNASSSYCGGIAGYCYSSITSCVFDGTVNGTEYVGGICGYTYGDIISSIVMGSVSSTGSYTGGLAGEGTTVKSCIFQGDLTGSSYTGGIIGNASSSCVITNCSVEGSLTGGQYLAGFIGYAAHSLTITNSYFIGDMACAASSGDCGFLYGMSTSYTLSIDSCFVIADVVCTNTKSTDTTVSGESVGISSKIAPTGITNTYWYGNITFTDIIETRKYIVDGSGTTPTFEGFYYSDLVNGGYPFINYYGFSTGQDVYSYLIGLGFVEI